MVVSGAAPLLLAAAHNYDSKALSLWQVRTGHFSVAPWGTALDVARELEDEGGGYIKTYQGQWPMTRRSPWPSGLHVCVVARYRETERQTREA